MKMRTEIDHASFKERNCFSVSSFHSVVERGFSLEREWGD